jgi:hypothetical protein
MESSSFFTKSRAPDSLSGAKAKRYRLRTRPARRIEIARSMGLEIAAAGCDPRMSGRDISRRPFQENRR